ncbi:TetR/AcrR family transcriptional regulator [Bradyrhizobium sediminis]|uniref:TetR/AcrR family transcriptional regulator n=1 Tax=Bradyrhizobium sediminis TaxID=2840469 RepID=A0A975RSC3_9BRAD|nr:TetR/AcrR family transcriptional regulator [Bradyrhizobium sediminis]QWG17773.1 TetR/AcrR family transcriptional regulator [Bradyrhizobium sediminis]
MAKPVSERADLLPLLAEVFRAHGYEGATLALLGEATGLGKGSLYHFFPGGKAQMAAEVLAEIDRWFEVNIFAPLRESDDPARAVATMIGAVDSYFRSGQRVCLVGVIALGASRDMFAVQVQGYFSRWHDALARVLGRSGLSARVARQRSTDALVTIQGALVLARALGDSRIFGQTMANLTARLLARPE